MAKKKELHDSVTQGPTETDASKLEAIQNKLKEHEDTLDNFRTSFQNIETKLKNLIERNRLR
jgi:hypothetical protein